MNTPMDLSQEQLMGILDIATDALEEIAGGSNSRTPLSGKAAQDRALIALDNIAHKTMKYMEGDSGEVQDD